MIEEFLAVFYGVAFVALLTKYLEWSAMWNMSIVISVLEGISGYEAFALSAYFSKGSERRGLILMIVFFVWGLGLRLPCLYFGCYEGWLGISVQIRLFCLRNVLKSVVCMVYFYDCKKRILEKKVDEEVGRDVKDVDEEVKIGSMQSQCRMRSYSSSVDLV
jgi:Na+-driven multidrug efflux pump